MLVVGQLNRDSQNLHENVRYLPAVIAGGSNFCKHLLMLHSELLVQGVYECLNSFYWNIVLKVAI